ncbi:MAG TPA: hypothetical protein VGQ69_14000 [Gemmatimonadales bacterium]|jgi:hypothetical protein|nr:hypothetical protein [Gemmatimonadales bacterium]
MKPELSLLLAVILAVPAGLAAQDSSKPAPKPNRNADLITRQEIEALTDVQTAFEVVSRLRPNWLRARQGSVTAGSAEIVVYVNEVRRGGPSALREVDRLQVAEIRRLRGSDATTRFGTDHEQGAILVKLK